jgi:hypothetical protein
LLADPAERFSAFNQSFLAVTARHMKDIQWRRIG